MAEGGFITKEIDRTMQFDDVTAGAERSLWTLLLSSGYLQAKVVSQYANSVEAEISIPNREVKYVYIAIFNDWLRKQIDQVKGKSYSYTSLIEYLKEGSIKEFCEGISDFFLTTVSTYDVRKDPKENFYHDFILATLVLMKQIHFDYLYSNRESGLGRFDIVFEPSDPKKDVGIIIELKRIGLGSASRRMVLKTQLKQEAQTGLEQIRNMKYACELQARGVTKAALISFAFCGKQVEYAYQDPVEIKELLRDTETKRRKIAPEDTDEKAEIKSALIRRNVEKGRSRRKDVGRGAACRRTRGGTHSFFKPPPKHQVKTVANSKMRTMER